MKKVKKETRGIAWRGIAWRGGFKKQIWAELLKISSLEIWQVGERMVVLKQSNVTYPCGHPT